MFLVISLFLVARANGQTKIMCLGDSITEGYAGWASYRYPLWFDLRAAGYQVDFVGRWQGYHLSQGSPDTGGYYLRYLTEFDRDHEGYSGWTTGQVAAVVTQEATLYQPDIVLLLLGGNDLRQMPLGIANVDSADSNLRLIIARLRSARPGVTVLLATNIPRDDNPNFSQYVQPLNVRIAAIAASMDLPQSRVLLVDQYTGYDLNSMMQIDGLHPNTAGEQRIADVWREALSTVLAGHAPCPHLQSDLPTNSLIALYTFDGEGSNPFDDRSFHDVTSSKNGLIKGLGNPMIVSAGYEGNGVLLDGQSYLRADVAIHPLVHRQLTMGAWVNLASTAGGNTLLSQDNGGFDRTLGISNHAGGLGWEAFAGENGGTTGQGAVGFVPGQAGVWQLVAAVYDADTSQVMLYVDGHVVPGFGSPTTPCSGVRVINGYLDACACGQNLFVGKEPFGNGSNCAVPNAVYTLGGTIDNVFVMSESLSVTRLHEIKDFGYHRIPTCATIFSAPSCRTGCRGGSTIFSVDAGGSGGVIYQWRKNGTPIEVAINPSAASATLTLNNIADADVASYDCVVTNACGSATSNAATLTICHADFNCSGSLSVQDIFDFLNAWFSNDLAADFNGNGLSVQDIFDFLNAWFAGC